MDQGQLWTFRTLAGLICCAAACSMPAPGTGKHEPAQAKGPVVALVDGEPIELAEVQELVRATGLPPALALSRLEEEHLLAAYAAKRGYGGTGRELKQARVRALLQMAVEARTAPEDVAASEVRERFEAIKAGNPKVTREFADYQADLRAQLSNQKRKASLALLIETLKARDPVQFNEPVAQKALASDSLLGTLP